MIWPLLNPAARRDAEGEKDSVVMVPPERGISFFEVRVAEEAEREREEMWSVESSPATARRVSMAARARGENFVG